MFEKCFILREELRKPSETEITLINIRAENTKNREEFSGRF